MRRSHRRLRPNLRISPRRPARAREEHSPNTRSRLHWPRMSSGCTLSLAYRRQPGQVEDSFRWIGSDGSVDSIGVPEIDCSPFDPLVGRRLRRGSVIPADNACRLVEIASKPPDQLAADETRCPGDQDRHTAASFRLAVAPARCRSSSASTISAIISSRLIGGVQPSCSLAFVASPSSTSTSAGRWYFGSMTT